MNIIMYSKALYSTWVYYSPDRMLVDCGEGVSTYLGNKSFAVKRVFLTHGHADHIAGLWGLVNTRNNAMGDKEKELEIYYPKGGKSVEEFLDFILKVNDDLKYNLLIKPIDVGEEVVLHRTGGVKRVIRPFRTHHTMNEVSFGYNIYEKRKHLKDEYRNMDQKDILDLIKKYGREEITVDYEHKILTISGDAVPISSKDAYGTDLLIHESTFLDENDRKGNNHSSVKEVLKLAKSANVKSLILYHISTRYERNIKRYVNKAIEELEIDFPVMYVHPSKIFTLK
uniref:MBL fold metallo-hydrolase n=1 Tax=Mesoaciditoga lauensis TaxID=1495039 RepID=A0A7V3RF85_9BACT